jgi:glycosyltransferase involved in cell wall biosynthesis
MINNNDILLTIIIPVLNAQDTLERCLQSIDNQSLKNLEAIFIDNASTDNSAKIIDSFCSNTCISTQHIRLSVNEGPGGARNIGMNAAKGKYITFLDSDDWVDSDLYISVVNQLENYNAEIAIYGVMNEYENTRCSETRYIYKHTNLISNRFALRLLCHAQSNNAFISPMVCQKMIKRDFIKHNCLLFIPNCFYEDDYFSFQCFFHECKCLLVSDGYYHYYQNPKSITHNFSLKHIDDLVDVFKYIYNDLMNSGRYNEYHHDFFSYFDKSIASLTGQLFATESSAVIQREYLNYLFKNLLDAFPIEYWINYLDIQRISRLLIN